MRLPVRAQALEESPALLEVEPLPERRGFAADRGDDLAPVDNVGRLVSHFAPKGAEHADRGVGPRLEVGRCVEMRRRHRGDAVRLRQEPAARHCVDATTVVEVAERKRDVAHGEAGSEQQHVLASVQLERVPRPRIAGVAKARVHLFAALDPRVGRREVPDREHRLVGVQHPPVRERQLHGRPLLGDRDDLAGDPGQWQRGRTSRLVEPRREVLAVGSARDEGTAGERRVARPDEPEKVVRIVLERAHPARRHVQRVAAGGRRVRDAADLPLDPLDEQHPADGRRRQSEKVDRDRRSAESSPDDRDRALRAHIR